MILQLDIAYSLLYRTYSVAFDKKTYHQKVQDVQLQAAAPSNKSVLSEDLQYYKKSVSNETDFSETHIHVISVSPHSAIFFSLRINSSASFSLILITVGVYSYSVISFSPHL